MTIRIVVLGGSFGGLASSYELRKHLQPEQCQITLISKDENFTYIPSLPLLALGTRTPRQISFHLAPPLRRNHITFAHETVISIEPEQQMVITDRQQHPYDYLVIATGHRSANEAVPGLGPFSGPGHSLMSLPEASEMRDALVRFVASPGPVVIGAAPGASCIGPSYEFLFELDYFLRRRQMRHQVPITFITPEPFLGHMGMGGVGKLRQLLEGKFEEHDISYRTSAAITKITKETVEVDGSKPVPSKLSMVIPPLAGVTAIADSAGLANPKGFIPVDPYYRHLTYSNIYAVGVAVALPPADETAVPVNFPKTGHMTEQMATIASLDIVGKIHGRQTRTHQLSARCVLDIGNKGVYLAVDPVRPPRDKLPTIAEGRHWLWTKQIFEQTYLWRAKRGQRVPTTFGW